ncbi:MAG TPA: helix-turn-helix domain-containing protein [Clostridia bacterium]|nr:helix-turn-helix domain-containing protein [Clostridia bacterium]
MQFLCDEVGIDFTKFVDSLAGNKKEMEMAQEFGVSEATIKSLRERFYKAEAIMGNYGQD